MLTIWLHHLFGGALLQPPHVRTSPVHRWQIGVHAAFDDATASDFTSAFPALLSAIMPTAIYGPGLAMSIVAIGIFNIPVFARITRGAANAVWSRDFITAARAAGKG